MNTPNGEVPSEVPPHDVRQFWADTQNAEFVAYRTLEEASRDPEAAAVLSGDYGGTIFLTVPVARLRCDLDTLQTLVSDLDSVTWMSGDLTIATVALERHAVGSGVVGGDGGGVVVDGVWTHPTRLPQEIRDQAAAVVLGLRPRIDLPLLREERERSLARKKAWRLTHPPRSLQLAWDFDISPPAVPLEYGSSRLPIGMSDHDSGRHPRFFEVKRRR